MEIERYQMKQKKTWIIKINKTKQEIVLTLKEWRRLLKEKASLTYFTDYQCSLNIYNSTWSSTQNIIKTDEETRMYKS